MLGTGLSKEKILGDDVEGSGAVTKDVAVCKENTGKVCTREFSLDCL